MDLGESPGACRENRWGKERAVLCGADSQDVKHRTGGRKQLYVSLYSGPKQGLESQQSREEKAWGQTTDRHKGKGAAVDRKARDCWYEYTPHGRG